MRLSHHRGFTLVELLVVIAIIAVLSAAGFAGLTKARKNAQRTVAVQHMKEIGMAIPSFASDNAGRLPGPLYPGQRAVYDPEAVGSLLTEIAEYVGVTYTGKPKVADVFLPPLFKSSGIDPREGMPYVMNTRITMDNGQPEDPWGEVDSGATSGMPIARIPSDAWGFSDADQKHPRVVKQPWAKFTPEEPIHGKRLAWFFDGRVESVTEDKVWRYGRERVTAIAVDRGDGLQGGEGL